MFGPDVTFTGVPRCDLGDPISYAGSRAVIIGAPYDSGTSYRSGARFGPRAIRSCDYSHHNGSRPHMALRVDPLVDLVVKDAGDVRMPPGETVRAMHLLSDAVRNVVARGVVPVVLGGDHTVAMADITAMAEHLGYGRVSVIHFDAHADTGDLEFGSLYGHGQPMRRVIESGAVRGDRFLQMGLRGYWPGPDTLAWMAQQGMRSFEMAEICRRGLDDALSEALTIATDGTDGVFLSVDIDVVDPAGAPGTGTPEPGGLTSRELLDAVRRIGREAPLLGMEIVEVAPSYDISDVTAMLANRVVLETLAGLARADADRVVGTRWDETAPVLSGRGRPGPVDKHGRLRVLLVGNAGDTAVTAETVTEVIGRDEVGSVVVAGADSEQLVRAVTAVGDGRALATMVDPTDVRAVTKLIGRYQCDVLVDAGDGRDSPALAAAARDAGVDYQLWSESEVSERAIARGQTHDSLV